MATQIITGGPSKYDFLLALSEHSQRSSRTVCFKAGDEWMEVIIDSISRQFLSPDVRNINYWFFSGVIAKNHDVAVKGFYSTKTRQGEVETKTMHQVAMPPVLRLHTFVNLGEREVCISTILDSRLNGEEITPYDHETIIFLSEYEKITDHGGLFSERFQGQMDALEGHNSIVHRLITGEIRLDFNYCESRSDKEE